MPLRSIEQDVASRLLDGGMISPEDSTLYRRTDRVDEAVDEILRFYRIYHSMRYVRRRLVLRLHQPLSPRRLEAVNAESGDIIRRSMPANM